MFPTSRASRSLRHAASNRDANDVRTRTILRRVAWSLLAAAALVSLATVAIFATAQSALVSLLIEPFSLLLLPGLLISLAAAGPHDFDSRLVVLASFVWYFLLFNLLFYWIARRRAR